MASSVRPGWECRAGSCAGDLLRRSNARQSTSRGCLPKDRAAREDPASCPPTPSFLKANREAHPLRRMGEVREVFEAVLNLDPFNAPSSSVTQTCSRGL